MRHLQAHALEEDRQVLAASVDPFTGVLIAAGVGQRILASTSVSFHMFNHDDLVKTVDAADEQSFTDAGESSTLRWVAHPSFYHNARQVKDNQERPLFVDMPAAMPSGLIGYPFSRSIKAPKQSGNTASKAFAAFGDWKYVWIGDRRSVEVGYSEHVKYGEAQVMLRVMARVGVLVVLPAAFSRLVTAAA
jgi:HK97 family phage major capsid protein